MFCLPGSLSSQTKQSYKLVWSTLNSGGSTESATSANYTLKDAIGQPIVGEASSENYSASSGFWSAPQAQQVMGVEEKLITGFNTHETRLFQNYPNPFNTHTAISYSLAMSTVDGRPTAVSLKIFDLSGRLVKTFDLTNNERSINQVVWNGRDEQGQKVAPGIYFYKLETQGYKSTKKMILLR